MSATVIALYVSGGFFELAGIVLVGSPDLFPYARRIAELLHPRYRSAINRVRRVLGLPAHVTVVALEAAIEASAAIGASASTAIRKDAPLEDKVDFLLSRDQEAQRLENAFASRLNGIEADMPNRLAQLRNEMDAHVADAIASAQEAYGELRRVGIGVLIVGLGCTTAANFV